MNARKELQFKINAALEIAFRYGTIAGDHHKMWVIDQMCQQLLGDAYKEWRCLGGKDWPWDEGIPP